MVIIVHGDSPLICSAPSIRPRPKAHTLPVHQSPWPLMEAEGRRNGESDKNGVNERKIEKCSSSFEICLPKLASLSVGECQLVGPIAMFHSGVE